MAIPVKFFRSTDVGAPTLNGTAGSLISVLDACLINGYNAVTVQGITRVGQVATVTFAVNHNIPNDGLTPVVLSGFNQAEYNGEFMPTNMTATTFDITVTGTPATPATGTGTCKVAPAGWTKAFSGTNVAAYRSSALDATRMFMRVNDNNPNNDSNRSSLIVGYENMTDVNTGTGPFPTVAQMANGLFLNKSTVGDSSSRKWYLIADDREILFFYGTRADYPNLYRHFHFGDFASELASDPFGCLIYGDSGVGYDGQTNVGNSTYVQNHAGYTLAQHYIARSYTQVGTSVLGCKFTMNPNNAAGWFGNGSSGVTPYPAKGNNQMYVFPVYVSENSQNLPIRGQIKGLYNPGHAGWPLGHGGTYSNLSALPGRTLFAISSTVANDPGVGEIHVDITGPWR